MTSTNPKSKIRNQKCFTLIELLVVVAIIAVLVAILIPALAAARKQALNVSCRSRLHQVGLTVQFYAGDNHDWFWVTPDYAAWHSYPSYMPSLAWIYRKHWSSKWEAYLFCPAAERLRAGATTDALDYGGSCSVQDWLTPPQGHSRPRKLTDYANRPIVADRFWTWGGVGTYWHETGVNVLWGDQSVRWFEDNPGILVDITAYEVGGYYTTAVAFDYISSHSPH